jgi:predicted permease
MDGTVKFLLFLLFSLGGLAGGYLARKRGWLREESSRRIHHQALIWLWSPATLVSFWGLPMRGEDGAQLVKLMLAQPVMMVVLAALMMPVARWAGCGRRQMGVMMQGAGLSNQGFTPGSFLCYALLDPPDLALRYGMAYATSSMVFMVLIFYPLANYMAQTAAGAADAAGAVEGDTEPPPPMSRLLYDSFFTTRAMPLYLALVGVALQLAAVPAPKQLVDWHLIELLFFAGSFAAYLGVGLRLWLGDSWRYKRMHALLAGWHFMMQPVVALGLLAALAAIGSPIVLVPRAVLLLQSFTPAALNMVIIANLFHLDARMASVLWLWNTILFCVLILPALMWFYY